MRSLAPRLLVPVLLILAVALAAAEAPAAPAYFWPPARDVAIFKDGCAYIVREGEIEAPAEGVLTEGIPSPVLGTLDIYSLTDGVYVSEVVSFFDLTAKQDKITDVESFYRQQIGAKITLAYDGATLEGVLRAILSPGYLVLEANGNTVLIHMAGITKLTVAGAAGLEVPAKIGKPRFLIRLTGVPHRVKLGISYLNESWSWIPSYRINIRPENQAELVLNATIINNDENVKDIMLHLIVGVPNFMLRGTVSPMALDVDSGSIAAASPFKRPALTKDYAPEAAADEGRPVPAGEVEELFVYEKKGFTLRQGERMQLELFRGIIPCVSVYKWEIPLPDTSQTYSQNYLQQQGKIRAEQPSAFWHYLRLTNKTLIPWTAGPAMVVSGWQPVAQDLLKAVPVEGSYDLRVLSAPDLKGTVKEEEIDRRIVRPANSRSDFLQITVRGTVVVENSKRRAVQIEIGKDLWGEVKEAGGAKAAKGVEYLWNINPRSRLEWQFELPANGKQEFTYTYDFYVQM